MMTYVFRNLKSSDSIIRDIISLLRPEVITGRNDCVILTDKVWIDVGKKYTSIKIIDSEYNIRPIKKIITEKRYE